MEMLLMGLVTVDEFDATNTALYSGLTTPWSATYLPIMGCADAELVGYTQQNAIDQYVIQCSSLEFYTGQDIVDVMENDADYAEDILPRLMTTDADDPKNNRRTVVAMIAPDSSSFDDLSKLDYFEGYISFLASKDSTMGLPSSEYSGVYSWSEVTYGRSTMDFCPPVITYQRIDPDTCTDTDAWVDDDGDTCADYEEYGYCYQADDFAVTNGSANDHCCVCMKEPFTGIGSNGIDEPDAEALWPPDCPIPTAPTFQPTMSPTQSPNTAPAPTTKPTASPSQTPTTTPSERPTTPPTASPIRTSYLPTAAPTAAPTLPPTIGPTAAPTSAPTPPLSGWDVLEAMASQTADYRGATRDPANNTAEFLANKVQARTAPPWPWMAHERDHWDEHDSPFQSKHPHDRRRHSRREHDGGFSIEDYENIIRQIEKQSAPASPTNDIRPAPDPERGFFYAQPLRSPDIYASMNST